MSIDPAEVRRIAELARLDLDAETLGAFGRQLGSVLDHVKVLRELPPSPPGGSAAAEEPRLREDVEQAGLSRDEALRNAPDAALGFFRVPRVLDE